MLAQLLLLWGKKYMFNNVYIVLKECYRNENVQINLNDHW